MKIYHSNDHAQHAPEGFIFRGARVACPETPARVEIFHESLAGRGHEMIEAGDVELKSIAAVHDADYLDFLQTAWTKWSALPGHGPEIMPNIHPNRNMSGRPDSIVGLSGIYQADCACPIGPGTWQAATGTAQCAVDAARAVTTGDAGFAYALCRPPGHHAFADMAGGFCFLNNSAIAAEICLGGDENKRVAILDVDVHHGNGTQGIFYERDDVLTVSLHGDPSIYYPFYAGYAEERGKGVGTGFNINLPLEAGTGDAAFLKALGPAMDSIAQFDPDFLVVALGLDASEADPLAFLHITTQGFGQIAAAIARLDVPTVLVQEGGYISDVLGENLATFLEHFERGKQAA